MYLTEETMGERGGGWGSGPRWTRILLMAVGSLTIATNFSLPSEHLGQRSRSSLNTLDRSFRQVRRTIGEFSSSPSLTKPFLTPGLRISNGAARQNTRSKELCARGGVESVLSPFL